MNNELQKKLYEMEVMPPGAVWEKLSEKIDEINGDITVAKIITGTEVSPPALVWGKIIDSIGVAEKQYRVKKGTLINFRRLAVAAIFISVIITAWLLFRNNDTTKTDAIAEGFKKIESKTTPDTNTTVKKDDVTKTDMSPATVPVAEANPQSIISKTIRNKWPINRNNKTFATPQTPTVEFASLKNEIPGGKSFDKPIDDLSLVTANDNYLTMVNSNGRLVKISSELAPLVPHLQDKPLSEDIYEVMFGEGTYWKETMDEWRKKLLSSSVTSGDAFTSFIELLKTIQGK